MNNQILNWTGGRKIYLEHILGLQFRHLHIVINLWIVAINDNLKDIATIVNHL